MFNVHSTLLSGLVLLILLPISLGAVIDLRNETVDNSKSVLTARSFYSASYVSTNGCPEDFKLGTFRLAKRDKITLVDNQGQYETPIMGEYQSTQIRIIMLANADDTQKKAMVGMLTPDSYNYPDKAMVDGNDKYNRDTWFIMGYIAPEDVGEEAAPQIPLDNHERLKEELEDAAGLRGHKSSGLHNFINTCMKVFCGS